MSTHGRQHNDRHPRTAGGLWFNLSFVIDNFEDQAQIQTKDCPTFKEKRPYGTHANIWLPVKVGIFRDALMEAKVLGHVRGYSRCKTEERLAEYDA